MKALIISISIFIFLLVGSYIGMHFVINNEVTKQLEVMKKESQGAVITATHGTVIYNPFSEVVKVSDLLIVSNSSSSGGVSAVKVSKIDMTLSRITVWDYYMSDQPQETFYLANSSYHIDGIEVSLDPSYTTQGIKSFGAPPFLTAGNKISGSVSGKTLVDEEVGGIRTTGEFFIDGLGGIDYDFDFAMPLSLVKHLQDGVLLTDTATTDKLMNEMPLISLSSIKLGFKTDGVRALLQYIHNVSLVGTPQKTPNDFDAYLAKMRDELKNVNFIRGKDADRTFKVLSDALSINSDIYMTLSTSKVISQENVGAVMMLPAARNGQEAWGLLEEHYGLDYNVSLSTSERFE